MNGRVGSLPSRPGTAAEAPPHNLEAEEAVLGALLLIDTAMPNVAVDVGLRAEHFFGRTYELIFGAMLALTDRGDRLDPLAVCTELDRRGQLGDRARGKVPQSEIDALAGAVPYAGNVEQYAREVVELAQLRQARLGALKILEGVAARDQAAIEEGEATLNLRAQAVGKRTFTPEEMADEVYAYLAAGPPDTFTWPFRRFDTLTLGGARRGQVTLVAGWSSHGKSVLIDMSLESMQCPGLRAHLYVNEMTRLERELRIVARLGPVDFGRLMLNQLRPDETARAADVLPRLPFGITDISGWSPQEVARDVRRNHYDIVGIDLLQKFPQKHRSRTQDMDEASQIFNQLSIEANCHVLLGCQLNRNRTGLGVELPFPSAADIRDSAMIYNDAPNCLFVWREQDKDTGEPQEEAIARFAKLRNGRPGGIDLTFEGHHQRFRPRLMAAA